MNQSYARKIVEFHCITENLYEHHRNVRGRDEDLDKMIKGISDRMEDLNASPGGHIRLDEQSPQGKQILLDVLEHMVSAADRLKELAWKQ